MKDGMSRWRHRTCPIDTERRKRMIYIFDAGLGKTRRGWPSDRAESSCVMDVDYRDEGAGHRADVVELGIAEIVWELFIFSSWLCRCMNNGQEPDRPAAVRPRDTGTGHGHAGKNRGNVLVVVCCDSSCVSSRRGRDERGCDCVDVGFSDLEMGFVETSICLPASQSKRPTIHIALPSERGS